MINSLADAFNGYKDMVIPDAAEKIQIDETRKSFYAGALLVLNTMLEIADENMTEEESVQVLENLMVEAAEFIKGEVT